VCDLLAVKLMKARGNMVQGPQLPGQLQPAQQVKTGPYIAIGTFQYEVLHSADRRLIHLDGSVFYRLDNPVHPSGLALLQKTSFEVIGLS
jgi:hypothetical protein